MQTYNYVKEISNYYSYWDFQEAWREEGNWSVEVDFEATARRLWRYLVNTGDIREARKQPTQERAREYLHLSILDYYSMFEPLVKEKANVAF